MIDMKPKFDPHLSWGHIATIVSIIVGGTAVWTTLTQRVDSIEKQTAAITELVKTSTVQSIAIDTLKSAVAEQRSTNQAIIEKLTVIQLDVQTLKTRDADRRPLQ